jgi:riboflavin kinase/FMN adenylyltransferase
VRIIRSLDKIPSDARPCALTIGNFDGVHLGHRQLLARVVDTAQANGWTPSLLTFHPHPTKIVAPERSPRLLSTPEQRFVWMAEAGIEQVFLLPFSREFSELTPEAFVRTVLIERMRARAIVVGDNFRFGNRQAGDVHRLEELGREYGFTTEVVHGVTLRGRTVSSTCLRQLIGSGKASTAWRMLGRPYSVEGEVVRGHGIGSRQTVPTLNLMTAAEILPANGVYVTCTHDLDDRRRWESITNVGTRPTFDGDTLTVETYLLSPLNGETPERIRVEFLYRLRDERRFASPDELKLQILRDVNRANSFFRRLRVFGPQRAV